MMDTSILKSHLIDSKCLTEDALARAEDYALTANMTLDEAIVFLKLMNYSALGQCLSEIYQKPYIALLGKGPLDIARTKVSQNTAEALHVFPLTFDARANTLTLAVDDPSDPELMKNLRTSVSPSMVFDLTVASKAEIHMAIDVYYKGRLYVPERELSLPKGFTIVSSDKKSKETLDLDEESKSGSRILLVEPDLERSRAIITLLRREGFPHVKWVASLKEAAKVLEEEAVDRLVANGRTFKSQENWMKQQPFADMSSGLSFYNIRNMLLEREYPYTQMSEALLSLVSFVIRRGLQTDAEQLAEIVATARYCKLLAMRMGLPAIQVDGAVLAAWLSAPGIGRVIHEHISSPYPLEEIFETDGKVSHPEGMEALILRLVKKYQVLKKKSPDIAGDIDKVRKELCLPDDATRDRSLLEAFLNVIKDEEFLKDAGRSRRRILMVDPDYSRDSALVLRLSNDGYEVVGVSDARAAAKIILDSGADLVISEVNLPETEGMCFCRALRENAASAHIPFFFLTRERGDRLATQCLEAGADDFFPKPPDLEMLSIKIRNILALKNSRGTRSGISGTLADMSFTDIIQSLTTGEKDVEIQLQNGGKKGVIYIQQGEIIYAQTQGLKGQDAFYRLMTWQDGEFEIKACTAVPPRNIFESAMSLLMEGARIADETNLQEELLSVHVKLS
jgi:DNA-binding response OmpR family regulator